MLRCRGGACPVSRCQAENWQCKRRRGKPRLYGKYIDSHKNGRLRGRFLGSQTFSLQRDSVQMEIDFDANQRGDRLAIFLGRLEAPFFYGFYGLFIQAQS